MNIFFLSPCYKPHIIAAYHCDKHLPSQIKEAAQMLAQAMIMTKVPESLMPVTVEGAPMKGGHPHHPITQWVCADLDNFYWTKSLLKALMQEYAWRTGKQHFYWDQLEKFRVSCIGIVSNKTIFPEHGAIGEDTKTFQTYGRALWNKPLWQQYQLYYIHDKREMLTYTRRAIPSWLPEGLGTQAPYKETFAQRMARIYNKK